MKSDDQNLRRVSEKMLNIHLVYLKKDFNYLRME